MSAATLLRQTTIDAASGVTTLPILIYLRISRDKEGNEAGVERQREDCRELAASVPGGVIVETHCDNDISASTNHDVEHLPRPAYVALLARAARLAKSHGGCMIIAWKTSRLTRRPGENEDMIRLARQHNVEFKFCKSPSFALRTANGAFVSRILAAVDAELPESISEQGRRQKLQAAQAGTYRGGGRPFGYRVEYSYGDNGLPIKPGRLVIDEREAALIRGAVDYVLTTAGKPNLTEIARQWTASGVSPTQTKGGAWCQSSVRSVLMRGRNAGRSERYKADVGQGQWEAIITPDQLAAVRGRLDAKGRQCNPSNTRKWLLSALAHCGEPACDSRMRSSGPTYKGRDCGHCVIPAEMADTKVRGVVASLLHAHGASLLAETRSEDLERLTSEAVAIRGKIEALAHAFADSINASPTALAVATGRLEVRLTEITAERAALTVADSALVGVADAPNPVRAFLDAPLERQRSIVDALVRVTILPGVAGRVTAEYRAAHPLEDRVQITRH